MTYYENKVLQDRESHMIGAGISLILMSPAFGIVAGLFLGSAIVLYAVTILFALFGVLSIIAGIKERINRKHNQTS